MSDRLAAEPGTLEEVAKDLWATWCGATPMCLENQMMLLRAALHDAGIETPTGDMSYLYLIAHGRFLMRWEARQREREEQYLVILERSNELEEERAWRERYWSRLFGAWAALERIWDWLCFLPRKWKLIERLDAIMAESLAAVLCGILLLAGRRSDGSNS